MRIAFALAALAISTAGQAQPADPPAPTETAEARVADILSKVPLTDGHNDWPIALRGAYGYAGALTADLAIPAAGPFGRGHTTLQWLRDGQVGAQLWSAYVSANLAPDEAVKQTFEQIEVAHSIIARHPEHFTFVTTADQMEAAFRSGRIASFIALEGAHQINDDIAILRRAYDRGVRSMTLSHSQPTLLFDSATAHPRHDGMASGAAAMIAEMNRLGILVDLSHVSPATMHAVLDVTKAPVIFSHSSAKAVTSHPRNAPDDVLRRVAENGGLVMVTFVPAFIDQSRADWQSRRDAQRLVAGQGEAANAAMKAWDNANPRPVSTLAMVADHIVHIARVAGHDHVGLGGDYDGIPDLPEGLENVSTYPRLLAELARRGWSDADLEKLAGRNFLRVLRANEAAARKITASR